MLLMFLIEILAFIFIPVFYSMPGLFSKKSHSTINTIIIVYFCINFLLAITNCGVVCIKRSRGSARQKACLSNCRVIMGGAEIYNEDNPENKMTTLDLKKLVEKKYIMPIPKIESECEYVSEGDLSKDGKVICLLHSDEKRFEEWERKRKNGDFWESPLGKGLSLFWHSIIGLLFRALFFPVTLPFLVG